MAAYKSQYTGQQIDEGISKANRATTDLVEVKGDVATNKRKINSLSFSGEAQTTNPLRTIGYNDELYNVPSVSANPLSAGKEIELEKIEVNGNVYKITHPTQLKSDHLYKHRITFTPGNIGYAGSDVMAFDIYVLGYHTPFTDSLSYVNPFTVSGTIGMYFAGEFNRPIFAIGYNLITPLISTAWNLLTTPDIAALTLESNAIMLRTIPLRKLANINPQYTDEVTPV